MTSGRKFLAVLVALLVFVCAFLFARSYVLEGRYSKAQVELDKKKEEVDRLLGQLSEANSALVESNKQLQEANRALVEKDRRIAEERRRVRLETAAKVESVRSLPVQQVAEQTAEVLQLPLSVRADAQGVVFTEEAARKNLDELLLGAGSRREVDLLDQRVALLEKQNANLEKVVENLEKVAENKDKEIAAVNDLRVQESKAHEAEVSALRAKSRKRNVVLAVLGFIGGVLFMGR